MKLQEGKQIFVTRKELDEYLTTAKKANKIRYFWKEILLKAPKAIRQSLRTTFISLVEQNEGEYSIVGAKAYCFETEIFNLELNQYLSRYVVFVEDPEGNPNRWSVTFKKVTEQMRKDALESRNAVLKNL